MSISWRVGRIGAMLISLNYTWLPVGGLALWILALRWLPPYLNHAPSWAPWALASAVVVLYAAGLLLVEAVRTRVAGIFSATWPRSVHLFPFGPASAYPLDRISPSRAMGVALIGPVILGLFSYLYGQAADLLTGQGPAFLEGTLRALAAANQYAALITLAPGLPLAGGWLLVAICRWFGMDSEHATGFADRVGLAAVLTLLIVGGAIIIGAGDWALALSALAVAWTVREGATAVEGRVITGRVMEQLSAGEVMQPPVAMVRPDDSLEYAFRLPHLGTAEVLPVAEADGTFAGLLPLGLSDTLLQGTWPATAVRSMMIPVAALRVAEPDTPLPECLTLLGHPVRTAVTTIGDEDDEASPVGYLPVVDKGRLRGVIGWDQVAEFERLGASADVQEAAALEEQVNHPRRLLMWGGLLLVAFVALQIVAALGTRIVSPTLVQPTATPLPADAVLFGTPNPADGGLVARGDIVVSIPIKASVAIQSVTMTYDGQPLDTTLLAPGTNDMEAKATTSAVLLGVHTVEVTVQTTAGLTRTTNWTFRVVEAGASTPVSPAEAAPTVPAPAVPANPDYTPPAVPKPAGPGGPQQ